MYILFLEVWIYFVDFNVKTMQTLMESMFRVQDLGPDVGIRALKLHTFLYPLYFIFIFALKMVNKNFTKSLSKNFHFTNLSISYYKRIKKSSMTWRNFSISLVPCDNLSPKKNILFILVQKKLKPRENWLDYHFFLNL